MMHIYVAACFLLVMTATTLYGLWRVVMSNILVSPEKPIFLFFIFTGLCVLSRVSYVLAMDYDAMTMACK